MQTMKDCCPDIIDQFLAGTISSDQQVELEKHLTVCSHCDELLKQRTADPQFWHDTQSLLSSHDDRDWEASFVTPQILDIKHLLDPTDDPRMLGRFGGYEICGVIGSGGMGVVMKGHDVSLDRFVAIKILQPSFSGSSAARQRFSREAQAAAAVVHDNVIAIFGVDQWHEIPYLVMPYIKGESLQQRIDRSAPLSIENTLEISLQIARGLAAAHDQGLVHRDIKPANILIPESVSRVLITDFGLARAADDASLTRSGVIAGTPQYMSPEQAKGEPVDGRSDLFSLGSIMYAMCCGHPPFRADAALGVLWRITDQTPRRLSAIRSDTPAWMDQIVDRLLQKDPARRFDSATELADQLEDCLAYIRQPATAVMPKIVPTAKRESVVHRVRFVAVAALLVGIISLVAYYVPRLASHDQVHSGQPTASDVSSSANATVVHPWVYDDSELADLEGSLEQLFKDVSSDLTPQ